MKSINLVSTIGILALAVAIPATDARAGNPRSNGAPRLAPPQANAFGKSLTEWLATYWQWALSGADPEASKVGRVQLMPLPAGEHTGGSWTPDDPAVLTGSLEITLPPGTPFVLPLSAWIGERYEGYPTTPDDPPMADAVMLNGLHPTLTIDGKVLVSDANKEAFYVPVTSFDPIVEYPAPSDYGSVAAISFQSVGIVSPPLPPGTHTIHLYESMILLPGDYPGIPDGIGLIYDNTWTVHVVAH